MNEPIETGMAVFTDDGKDLGRIKELRSDAFLIDVPLKRDYWLPRSTVARVVEGVVHLLVDDEGLDKYRTDEAKA